MTVEEKQLKFKVDSALLSELGERLVETVHVALVELVKNAYDADATSVKVEFYKDENNKNCILVEDDGGGMSFVDVENYWMRIATNNKFSNNRSSKYGRLKTGSKGIGRFSCRRLGKHLQLKNGRLRWEGTSEDRSNLQMEKLQSREGCYRDSLPRSKNGP